MELEVLKKFSLFSFLDKDNLEKIKDICEIFEYKNNNIIFNEGDKGDALFLIIQGNIKISKIIDIEKNTAKDLAILSEGDFLGEMSLFSEQNRSASAVAAGDCSLLKISRDNFNALLDKEPKVGNKILFSMIQTLSNRFRTTNLELVTIYDTGKIIGKSQPLENMVEEILNRLLVNIGAEQSMLVLKNEAMELMEVIGIQPFNLELSSITNISMNNGLIGKTIDNNKCYIISDIENEQLEFEKEGYENKSILTAPIINEDMAIGAILFTHTQTGFFNNSHLNLIKGVASQIGAAIANAKFREEDQARERQSRKFIDF